MKNLTAEAAENAEINVDKDLSPGMRGKNGSMCDRSQKPITPRGSNQKTSALSASSSSVLWPSFEEGPEKERFFPKRIEDLKAAEIGENAEWIWMLTMSGVVFWKKMLCDLCVLCGDIFLSPDGAEAFIIS
jgi:hypothetical protein